MPTIVLDVTTLDPCLGRLLGAVQTRDAVPFDPVGVVCSDPVELDETQQATTGCNTAITLQHAQGQDATQLTFNRRSLASLAQVGGAVPVGYTPGTDTAPERYVEAIGRYFRRSMSVSDFDPTTFTTLQLAPNGTYTLTLRAAATSYGWVGAIEIPLRVRVDLTDTNGRLEGFAYP
jgi:hypothetical protein